MSRLQSLVNEIKSRIAKQYLRVAEIHIVQIILSALRSYHGRHGDSAAGSLTLTTIISLVPASIITLSIIANLPGVANYQQEIVSAVLNQFVPKNSETINLYLTQFIEDASSFSLLQLFLLTVSTLILIHSVNQSINQMFDTQHERHGVAVFAVYLAILVFGPILLGASLALSLYVAELPFISSVTGLVDEIAPISVWVPFFVTWLSLFAMYFFVPSEPVKPVSVLLGSLCAAVLIEISKFGFGLYVSNVQTYEVLYGALSAIPLFLIWVYLTWSIILFGAALTSCMKMPDQLKSQL